MAYKWVGYGKLHRIGSDDVEPGAVFEPTEAEKHHLEDRIKAVEPRDSDAEDADAETEADNESAESGEDAKGDDAETEAFTCGVNGCGRAVDSADATCWQHEEE